MKYFIKTRFQLFILFLKKKKEEFLFTNNEFKFLYMYSKHIHLVEIYLFLLMIFKFDYCSSVFELLTYCATNFSPKDATERIPTFNCIVISILD